MRISSSNNRNGGNSPNFRTFVQNNNGVGIVIEGPRGTGNRVEGTFTVDNDQEGVLITSSNNSIGDGQTIGREQDEEARNLISGNQIGIRITSSVGALPGSFARGSEILGNRIGTDVTGAAAWPNTLEGILIENSPGNVVGGLIPPSQNVIQGNGTDGIRITGPRSTANRVLSNFIGFDESKEQGWITVFVGNGVGARIESSGNTVGGAEDGARNIISTNKDAGIVISGGSASGNLIIGNYIGANPAGNLDFGNTFDGVRIENASDSTIGGSNTGEGNLISGNNRGASIPGASATGDRVLGNLRRRERPGQRGGRRADHRCARKCDRRRSPGREPERQARHRGA